MPPNHSKALGIATAVAVILTVALVWRRRPLPTGARAVATPAAAPSKPRKLPKLYLAEPPTSEITCLDWSPDSRQIAYGDAAGRVTLFDPQTSNMQGSLQVSRDPVSSLAFAPGGRRFVAGCGNDSNWNGIGPRGNGGVWDLPDGREVIRLQGISHLVSAVAFAPDGNSFATISNESVINPPDANGFFLKVWNANTGALEKLIGDAHFELQAMAFSPDGKLLAVSSVEVPGTRAGVDDGHLAARIELFRTAGFKPAGVLKFDNGDNINFAWTPDSKNVTFGFDSRYSENAGYGPIRDWDFATGQVTLVCGAGNERPDLAYYGVRELSWSNDGKALACLRRMSGTDSAVVDVWDAGNGVFGPPLRMGMDKVVNCLAFSPDRSQLATGGGIYSSPCGNVEVWSWRTGNATSDEHPPHPLLDTMTACPNGLLVTGCFADMGFGIESRDLKVWDLKTGQMVKQFQGGRDPDWLEYSKIKGLLVGGTLGLGPGSPGTWEYWKWPECRYLGDRTAPKSGPGAVPDPSLAAARATRPGGREEAEASGVIIWVTNKKSGASLVRLQVPHRVTALTYSSDGTKLVTLCDDGLVRVWGATDFQPKLTLQVLTEFPSGESVEPNTEWIANTPDGFYTGSPGSASWCEWYKDGLPDVGQDGQFCFNQPQLVATELSAPQSRPHVPEHAWLDRVWSGDLPNAFTAATPANAAGLHFTFGS